MGGGPLNRRKAAVGAYINNIATVSLYFVEQ